LAGVIILAWALVAIPWTTAANWPRFRGPNGTGIAADKDIPVKWGESDGILWKAPLPGLGNSSPIVWGEQIFVQSASADGKERLLLCLNATDGKLIWSRSVPGGQGKTHPKNTLASSTPATDGERVYALFWDGNDLELFAYDLKGELVWKRDLGAYTSQHGAGTSPMVYDGKVFVNNDQDGSAALQAFDAKTGQPAWEAKRTAFRACYSTPLLYEKPGGKAELIVASTAGITSYDPSSGTPNWNYTWTFDKMALRTVASAIASQGLLIANSGDGSGERNTIAIKAGGQGDVSKTNLVWENKKIFPYVPSMLAWEDRLYFVNDKGFAGCCETKTGTLLWNERLSGSDISASPILIDGKVYAINEQGEVYVFPAATSFKLLAKNTLDEPVLATPAVANNRLFIRGREHLFCIGKPAQK
jgi:outer membrane protein assembly factor BamB